LLCSSNPHRILLSHRILKSVQNMKLIVEELETNLMSLVIFITLNICSTCFEH